MITLTVSPVILAGQTVVVTYTDPTDDDDANALQDGDGNDVASFTIEPVNRSTVTGVPGAPTGLTATKAAGANRGTQIDLAWDEPSDPGLSQISGYRIEWSADGNAPWHELEADTGSTDRTYSDSGLPSPTTRHYRVSAINQQGTGSPSGTADATTDDTVGPVLESARTDTTGRAAFLVFDENTSAMATGLPLASALTVSADGVEIGIGDVARISDLATGRLSIRLGNLSPAIRQGQTVVVTYEDPTSGNDARAIQDTTGNDAASFTTGEGGVPAVVNRSTEAPEAPGKVPNLAAGPGGDTSIVLTWDRPADNGGRVIGSYRIEVSEDVDPLVWQELEATHDTMKDGAIERRYEHPGLDPATTRHYRVRAKNAVGDGDWSDEDGATTTSGAPDAPSGLTATPGLPSPPDGTTLIRLGWDAPTLAQEGDSRITGYRIEVSEDVDPLVWEALEDDTGNRNRIYRHTGLGSEVTRHYRVFAINDDGTSLASNVKDATTPDILGPVPLSATVLFSGLGINVVFDEIAVGDGSITFPQIPATAFRVTTGDGQQITVGGVSIVVTTRTVQVGNLSPLIKQGQTITVVYTDPTAGDDAAAVQDEHGNDAASFTLGPGQMVTVTNNSNEPATAPGKPQNVEAESGGDDRIVVTWDAPADNGGRAIADYRVEVSEDGNPPWAELAASHDTMNNGKFEYIHTGLETGDQRHYRVSARNAIGLGSASDTEMGVVELKGRVVLSAAAASVAEGGSVAWTVTATTDEDAQPESGLAMQVTVTSEDGTAAAPGDYAALEAAAGTVTFRRSDFGRRNVQGVGYRWVAVKRGPVAVAIADDVEVEAEENFALTMSIGSGGTGWVRGTDRVEVAIPDTDEWGIAVAAEPAEIAEGETREVALTARIVLGDGTVPAEDACVARFPVSVRLETGGTATAGTDYALDGALDGRTIAACAAQTGWRVTLTAAVDRVDDPGETLEFAPQLVEVPETAPALQAPAAVTVREARGVVLSAFALDVGEGGEESYTAVLTSRPTGTVRLTPSVSGDPDVTVEPARLTFTRDNWNQPQTLTVRADQDPDDEDDAARVSHGVTGADYGANGVTAGEVRVAVLDDDKTFGVMTVRLSDGADGAGTHDPAPAEHHGEPFHIALWWSETRTHDYEGPRKAIGADRAIRVTGAAVVPVRDEHTGSWTQSRLRLKLTPDGTDDVTLVLEPMDCSYPDWRQPRPDPYALCAWRRDGLGITGLAERVRWTVHGIGAAPAAPGNLTLGTDEILTVQAEVVDSRTVLVAGFDADRDASHWRVEAQAPGGDWSEPRVWQGAKHGSRHNVRLDGLAPDGAWAVRARWENRYGAGPWAEVRTTDGVAPPAPRGLAAAPGPDGRSVRLTWRPASAASAARYQYRLGRLEQTMAGGWLDIPDSGPGAAHRRSFTVHGVERVWEIKAQLRAVSASGQAGAASAEARVPAARPLVLQDGVALTSDPGEDGRYAIGDRIEVAVTMSRPVRHEGAAPVVKLRIGNETHDAALVRIRQPGTAGIGDSGDGSGDTLVFAYAVRQGDEDMDGIAIPANGLRLNGGRLLDASPGGRGDAAAVGLGRARHFPGHRVQGVLPEVTGIERLDNKVWVHFSRALQPWTLDPFLRNLQLGGQFHPDYSLSSPVLDAVIDARIVRGRGWSRNCARTETVCRTVRLTLGKVHRPGSPFAGHEAPGPGERVEIRYAPNPHHAKYRLRDAAGNEAPGFAPMVAVHLAPGSAPVLAVDDGAGREGVAPVRFTVRLVPAATSEVTVDYMTADMPATVRAPAGRAKGGEKITTPDADYLIKSGTLVFAPGDRVKTVAVTIIEDTVPDSGEVFRLLLANPSGAVLGDAEATGTIRNDELLTAAFGAVPPSHDGETAFTLGLAFSEEVAVSAQMLRDAALSVTGGSVTGVRQVDAASTRRWEIAVAPSSDAAVTVALAPQASCDAAGAVCTEDGLGLDRAAEAAVPGPAALGAPAVAGVAQVGSTLEASVAGTPAGAVTWQWLRGGEAIAGADASAYTPVAADVGARLAVRAGRGGAAATGAATAPVWPAPVNPPLAAGEEELLSAVLTLEAWHGFPLRVAGYGRVLDSRFGEMDGTAFEDGGTPRAVSVFAVNRLGTFVLATGAAAPRAAGLVAYWNGHRIAGLEAETAGGVAVLSGPTPQPRAAYLRYMDGSSDGVRVAVSLRRTRAAVRVTGAAVTSGPGDNGTWDAGEHVEAEVRFSGPVTVTGPPDAAPTLAIALDGTRREAAYTGARARTRSRSATRPSPGTRARSGPGSWRTGWRSTARSSAPATAARSTPGSRSPPG